MRINIIELERKVSKEDSGQLSQKHWELEKFEIRDIFIGFDNTEGIGEAGHF